SQSDILYGTVYNDRMVGGAGDDTYYVNNVGDQVVERQSGWRGGTDTVIASVDYTLPAYVENLTLAEGLFAHKATGNSLANTIIGNSLNNVIDGGSGADTMEGGAGSDTYYVDNVNDKIIEHLFDNVDGRVVYGGHDTVIASVNYTLPNYV